MGIFKRDNNAGATSRMDGWKTLIVAIINVVGFFFPAFAEWVASNPAQYGALLSTAMIVLRIVTRKPIAGLGDPAPYVMATPIPGPVPQHQPQLTETAGYQGYPAPNQGYPQPVPNQPYTPPQSGNLPPNRGAEEPVNPDQV